MQVSDCSFFSSFKRITARVRTPEGKGPFPAVVINHGYSGGEQEYDDMAAYLCENGYLTLQFDSRGCGSSEAEKGAMFCTTQWLEDAINAVSFICSLRKTDRKRIAFTGCSIGGGISMYMAALEPRIKTVVAMAPLMDGPAMLMENWVKNRGKRAYLSFLSAMKEDLQMISRGKLSKIVSVPYALGMTEEDEEEYMAERNARPNLVSHVPLSSVFNSFLFFRPMDFCLRISIPVLILHGDHDTIVSMEQSSRAISLLNQDSRMEVVEGGIHALPTSPQAQKVFELSLDWLNEHLT